MLARFTIVWRNNARLNMMMIADRARQSQMSQARWNLLHDLPSNRWGMVYGQWCVSCLAVIVWRKAKFSRMTNEIFGDWMCTLEFGLCLVGEKVFVCSRLMRTLEIICGKYCWFVNWLIITDGFIQRQRLGSDWVDSNYLLGNSFLICW